MSVNEGHLLTPVLGEHYNGMKYYRARPLAAPPEVKAWPFGSYSDRAATLSEFVSGDAPTKQETANCEMALRCENFELSMTGMGHVWTAPPWQELSDLLQHWSGAVMCPACLCCGETAGHNALRARCHRICADYGLQRVSRVAQVATDLWKCHDDDVLVERDEEHRERKQCQDRRVPFPANVAFNNSASPWGTMDTHRAASSSPCAADESNRSACN
jgi:hypothetical protein